MDQVAGVGLWLWLLLSFLSVGLAQKFVVKDFEELVDWEFLDSIKRFFFLVFLLGWFKVQTDEFRPEENAVGLLYKLRKN